MILFKAFYINMDNNQERIEMIEVPDMECMTLLDAFSKAISKAHKSKACNEIVSKIEYISC